MSLTAEGDAPLYRIVRLVWGGHGSRYLIRMPNDHFLCESGRVVSFASVAEAESEARARAWLLRHDESGATECDHYELDALLALAEGGLPDVAEVFSLMAVLRELGESCGDTGVVRLEGSTSLALLLWQDGVLTDELRERLFSVAKGLRSWLERELWDSPAQGPSVEEVLGALTEGEFDRVARYLSDKALPDESAESALASAGLRFVDDLWSVCDLEESDFLSLSELLTTSFVWSSEVPTQQAALAVHFDEDSSCWPQLSAACRRFLSDAVPLADRLGLATEERYNFLMLLEFEAAMEIVRCGFSDD